MTILTIVNLLERENKENKCDTIIEIVNKLMNFMILKNKYCARFFKKHRYKISDLNIFFDVYDPASSKFSFEKYLL